MFLGIKGDVNSIYERDPAARSRWEVLLCYPGLHAIIAHRVAHWLWNKDWKGKRKSTFPVQPLLNRN